MGNVAQLMERQMGSVVQLMERQMGSVVQLVERQVGNVTPNVMAPHAPHCERVRCSSLQAHKACHLVTGDPRHYAKQPSS